jgi:protein-S-isoprenylcysteine O-methyltransferase Ste14
MHPMLRELLMEPVGWMTIIGLAIMFGTALVVAVYVRRKIREEERGK